LAGLLVRRDIIFMLMSVEIMLNAAGLAFIVAGLAQGHADGQVMFIFILAMAAAEVAVGLALILQMFDKFKSVDTNLTNTMKG
jgi:NADH-quinone oxidoreductase subunit K